MNDESLIIRAHRKALHQRYYSLLRCAWLYLTMVISACTVDGPVARSTTRDSALVRIVESTSPVWGPNDGWRISSEPEIAIGRVEGDPHYLLDIAMWPSRLSDGRIVVPNVRSSTLKLYTAGGLWMSEFGRRGRGPGEFAFIYGVWIHADTITVYDATNLRISWFKPDGSFLRDVALGPDAHGVPFGELDDGYLVIGVIINDEEAARTRLSRDRLELLVFNPVGQLQSAVGHVLGLERYRFDETDRNGSMVLPFTPIHHVSTRHDQLLVSDGDRPEVRVLDQNGRLIALYRWSDTVGPPDRATLQNLRDSVLADQQPPDRASYERWFAEMPERPLPAISAMQIGELGYIWMKRYDPSWDNQWTGSVWSKGAGGEWLVLDAEGVWQGVVNMPARFRPFQIGRDFILGVHHDDIGVASVQLYRLNR